ncbi:MAG: hypothetical protein JWM11_203 [Planctomycetaceae bacterium]|nr:hypothetical protein [Planctomycetaceae bacterium]
MLLNWGRVFKFHIWPEIDWNQGEFSAVAASGFSS